MFALDDLKKHTARLDLSGIDFAAFKAHPLSPEALRCLRYMHDVEYHTTCYLRDLLVTRAHQDHEISSFLMLWAFEEFWHGEAIGQVLAAHDEAHDEARVEPLRAEIRRREALKPFLHSMASLVAGREWLAVHMTWGAVNEWTTQAGYSRLSTREGHPVLTDLLKRIMRQEGRHIDFYSSHARRELEGSRRAQRVVRLALRRAWRPVGAGIMPEAELDHLIGHLFSGEGGAAAVARVDRHIQRLPGLEGLHLLQSAVSGRGGAWRERPGPRGEVVGDLAA